MIGPSLATLLTILIAINSWGWQESYLGTILGLFWLTITAYLVSGRIAGLAKTRGENLIIGTLLSAALISLIGTILFYFNLFNKPVIFILMALLPWLGKSTFQNYVNQSDQPIKSYRGWFIDLNYLIVILIWGSLLAAAVTSEAIRTPWQAVPAFILWLTALSATLVLIISQRHISFWWLVPFYFIFLSLLAFIYPLGYGFDPLIHQATEKLLLINGTINPKPLYYLGQYTLVTFFTVVLNLPLEKIDIWLLPILTSLAIPALVTNLARQLKGLNIKPLTLAMVPALFFLSDFTYTTPQGLAYLWVASAFLILAAIKFGQILPLWLPWLFALAALATHPLAGLPTLLLLAAWWFKDYGSKLKYQRHLVWSATISAMLIVPLAFIIFSWLKPSAASIAVTTNLKANLSRLSNDILYHLPQLPRFIDWPDVIYLWQWVSITIFIILGITGLVLANNQNRKLRWFGWAAIWPTASCLLLSLFFTFPNLPPNEQNFYTIRLWQLALLLWWPLVIYGSYHLLSYCFHKLKYPWSGAIAGGLLLAANFYLIYPRFDIWQRHTAYNTTAYDIEAVKLIETEAAGSPYVVLANQAVAAAAVREFGFNKYYSGHFYYPLPTGINPLYQIYLKAVEQGLPTRAIINEATTLGVSSVFLVLNRYWAQYDILSITAKNEANAWWEIGSGRLTVYRYDF